MDEIARRFKYHKLENEDQVKVIEFLREEFWALAEQIDSNVDGSREKSLAITKLEEGLYWTIAAIIRPKGSHDV